MEEKFDLYIQDKGLSDNTSSSYINDIKLFRKYYNDSYGEDLEQLIHTYVIMYVGYLKRNNYKASAINRKIAALKQYNSFLVDNNIQDANVIIKKDFIKIGSLLGKTRVSTLLGTSVSDSNSSSTYRLRHPTALASTRPSKKSQVYPTSMPLRVKTAAGPSLPLTCSDVNFKTEA